MNTIYMKLRMFCALHGVRIEDIKKIYVLGLGFGNADLGYIKHLVHATERISENPEGDLKKDEIAYLDNMDYDADKKRIEAVLSGLGCKDYTLYDSIDECIKGYKKSPFCSY